MEASVYLAAGVACLDAGDPAGAAEALRRAAYLDAENAFTQFNLGRAYLRLGATARGRSALLAARRILAAIDDREGVRDAAGLLAGELKRAVDVSITALATHTTRENATGDLERLYE